MLSHLYKCNCIPSLDMTNHLSLTSLILCSSGVSHTFPLKTLLPISSNLTQLHISPILLISPITWDLLITQHSKSMPVFLSSQPHIVKPMSSSISSLPLRSIQVFKLLNLRYHHINGDFLSCLFTLFTWLTFQVLNLKPLDSKIRLYFSNILLASFECLYIKTI